MQKIRTFKRALSEQGLRSQANTPESRLRTLQQIISLTNDNLKALITEYEAQEEKSSFLLDEIRELQDKMNAFHSEEEQLKMLLSNKSPKPQRKERKRSSASSIENTVRIMAEDEVEHTFENHTFFKPSYCDQCSKFMLIGLRCTAAEMLANTSPTSPSHTSSNHLGWDDHSLRMRKVKSAPKLQRVHSLNSQSNTMFVIEEENNAAPHFSGSSPRDSLFSHIRGGLTNSPRSSVKRQGRRYSMDAATTTSTSNALNPPSFPRLNSSSVDAHFNGSGGLGSLNNVRSQTPQSHRKMNSLDRSNPLAFFGGGFWGSVGGGDTGSARSSLREGDFDGQFSPKRGPLSPKNSWVSRKLSRNKRAPFLQSTASPPLSAQSHSQGSGTECDNSGTPPSGGSLGGSYKGSRRNQPPDLLGSLCNMYGEGDSAPAHSGGLYQFSSLGGGSSNFSEDDDPQSFNFRPAVPTGALGGGPMRHSSSTGNLPTLHQSNVLNSIGSTCHDRAGKLEKDGRTEGKSQRRESSGAAQLLASLIQPFKPKINVQPPSMDSLPRLEMPLSDKEITQQRERDRDGRFSPVTGRYLADDLREDVIAEAESQEEDGGDRTSNGLGSDEGPGELYPATVMEEDENEGDGYSYEDGEYAYEEGDDENYIENYIDDAIYEEDENEGDFLEEDENEDIEGEDDFSDGEPSASRRSSKTSTNSGLLLSVPGGVEDSDLNMFPSSDSLADWEIQHSELVYGKCAGSGSFGTVYKGKWHGDVAIKKLNFKEPSDAQLKDFRNEVAVLMKCRHENIIMFMGACTVAPDFCIVTEWCDGSTLYNYIHIKEDRELTLPKIISIAKQTARGMGYLHARDIIHRDLKSANIFLDLNLKVRIGDFGLAAAKSMWEGNERLDNPAGSIIWMAPEVIKLRGKNPYTQYSDVYSYGIVLYELLSGGLPYQGMFPDQIMFLVGMGIARLDMSQVREETPERLRQLLTDSVSHQADKRPLFRDICTVLESLANMQARALRRSDSFPPSRHAHDADNDTGFNQGPLFDNPLIAAVQQRAGRRRGSVVSNARFNLPLTPLATGAVEVSDSPINQ